MRKIFTSIDIGTSEVKVVTIEEFNDKYNVLASSCVKSSGVKMGLIVDASLVSSAIKKCLKEVESKLGTKINQVVAVVPSNNMNVVLKVGKTNNTNELISGEVIFNSMEDSIKNNIDPGMEVVAVMPVQYKIDGAKKVNNPLGLEGKTLESRNIICTVPDKNVYSVVSVIESLNVKVVDIVISSIADYYAIKSNELDNKVGAIINIGKEKTVASIFNKGIIMGEKIISIGSNVIDEELVFNYKIDLDEAIKIKKCFAVANRKYADGEEIYKYTDRLGNGFEINQYNLAELIEVKLIEMLKNIKNEINNLTNREINYIIVTGGITSMLGFSALIEELYGRYSEVMRLGVIGVRDNKFSTCYGSIKYFNEKLNLRENDYSMFNEEKIDELMQVRKKIGTGSVLGKIFGKIFE